MRTYIKDIKPGKKLVLQGWVQDIRDLGAIKFILLRDITGVVQITALKKQAAQKLFY